MTEVILMQAITTGAGKGERRRKRRWAPAKPTQPTSFKLSIEVINRINSSTFELRTLVGTRELGIETSYNCMLVVLE